MVVRDSFDIALFVHRFTIFVTLGSLKIDSFSTNGTDWCAVAVMAKVACNWHEGLFCEIIKSQEASVRRPCGIVDVAILVPKPRNELRQIATINDKVLRP